MTRTLPIVCSLVLAAVAPVLAAIAIGNLEAGAAVESSCLADVRAPVVPKVAPKAESSFCSAGASEVRP
jgi:hypothetical protein